MSALHPRPLPPDALLARYSEAGAYADCYGVEVEGTVSLAAYVAAFYTGRLFRLERLLLRLFLSKPSTDAQARQVAAGEVAEFAAWRVEGRRADQLLMCDVAGRTRSWFMVAQPSPGRTLLYFGSAVVPKIDRASGERRMGVLFNALLGFHKLYSRALLGAAASRLARSS